MQNIELEVAQIEKKFSYVKDERDRKMIIEDATIKLGLGWSLQDVITWTSCTEEAECELSEEVSLKVMSIIAIKYPR